MPSLSAAAKDNIQKALDTATGSATGVSGLVFSAIDKSGKVLTTQASGHKTLSTGPQHALDENSVFWIASCTKMITGIACMQLAEQGKLDLDSHDWLYKVCPELKDKQVISADGKSLEPRKGEITVRKLLSHTAGFGYSFFNERLRDFGRPTGWDEFSGDAKDFLRMPLVNHPGSRWEYGINIDWAGITVERTTGMSLDAYFKKNIFEPIGVKNISFHPDKEMISNMVGMQQRVGDTAVDYEHLARRNLWLSETEEEKARVFNAGGAGCFAQPQEYCKILATLLNNGESPTTGNRILSEKTVDEMFSNQIPEFPNFARQGIPAAKPHQTNPLPELYPQSGDPPQAWGLTFMLTLEPGATGRGANTGWWAGLVNLFWWCDREKGIAGMIAGQILPFGDPQVMGAWGGCEAAVYGGLEG